MAILDWAIRTLAITLVILVFTALLSPNLNGAFGASDYFAWHAIFAVLGVAMLSVGIISYVTDLGKLNYRLPDRSSRRTVHGIIQLSAVCCLAIAALLAWMGNQARGHTQSAKEEPTLNRAHVWIGYVVLAGAVFIGIVGIHKYIVRVRDGKITALWHGFAGPVVYLLAVSNVCVGTMMVIKEYGSTGMAIAIMTVVCSVAVLVLVEVFFIPQFRPEQLPMNTPNPNMSLGLLRGAGHASVNEGHGYAYPY